MSRYCDYGNDHEYAVLDYGRWERNARAVLKSKRGQKALAEIRDALLALPEKRLIDGALCTVGGVDKRLPAMTDDEFWQRAASSEAHAAQGGHADTAAEYGYKRAEYARQYREEEHANLARFIGSHGEGVCLIGAYLWHKRVKDGAGPAEAFDALPTVFGYDEGDPLQATAELGEAAGLAYTLAWELAYRNDETYRGKTPEQRYEAMLAWVEKQLGETARTAA